MQLPLIWNPLSASQRGHGIYDAAERIESVERLIENDPDLVPSGPSPLLVEPVLLEPGEIAALLADLVPMLEASAVGHLSELNRRDLAEGYSYESHASAGGCHSGDSKLPAFAWLFSHHAGVGRPTRHQQSHYLRAQIGR